MWKQLQKKYLGTSSLIYKVPTSQSLMFMVSSTPNGISSLTKYIKSGQKIIETRHL